MPCAAHDEVAQLSRLLNATVTVTARGKQKLAYDMPGYVGLNGLCGTQAGFSALWEAEGNFAPSGGHIFTTTSSGSQHHLESH